MDNNKNASKTTIMQWFKNLVVGRKKPSGNVITSDTSATITTNGTSLIGGGGAYGTITYFSATPSWTSLPSFSIDNVVIIGNGKLMEQSGELVWVRPDGSECVLTGKTSGFNNLYDKLSK